MKATYPSKVLEGHLKTLKTINWPVADDGVHAFVSSFIEPYERDSEGKVVKAPNAVGAMCGVKKVYDASTPAAAKKLIGGLVEEKKAIGYGVKVLMPNGKTKFGTLLAKEWERDGWVKFFGFDASALIMKTVKG